MIIIRFRWPERHADFAKAAALIERICPDASPHDIMKAWSEAVSRKGKSTDDELGEALRISGGNSLQADWWFKHYGRTPQYASLAETIAAHLSHFQTKEQIAQAEEQSKPSIGHVLANRMQTVPTEIRAQVLQGVLEELARRNKTGE